MRTSARPSRAERRSLARTILRQARWPRAVARGHLAALLAVGLLAGCGSDKRNSDSAQGGSAGTGGSAGNAGSGAYAGNAGTGGQNNTPAAFQGIWKQSSAELFIVDPANPGAFVTETVSIPATIEAPNDGRQVDVYHEIRDDQWVSYVFYAGDTVFFSARQPLTKSDDSYVAFLDDGTHLYEIKDGALVDTAITPFGGAQVTAEIQFTKRQGAFPPSSWPQRGVDLP
jgi:hypothetical protein